MHLSDPINQEDHSAPLFAGQSPPDGYDMRLYRHPTHMHTSEETTAEILNGAPVAEVASRLSHLVSLFAL